MLSFQTGASDVNRPNLFAMVFHLLAFLAAPTWATPVLIQFAGEIERENCVVCTGSDPFGGFFAIGDPFFGTIRYDPAAATVYRSHQDSTTLTTYFELPGASMSVNINGFTFESEPTEPLLSRVGSWQSVSIFNIDARLVPHSDEGVPEQSGIHGVTELGFALQDNSGAAFGTLFAQMPEADSPIFSALSGFNFIGDATGLCSLGTCINSFPEGIALTKMNDVVATAVPEPSTTTGLVSILGVALTRILATGRSRKLG